MPKFPQFSHQLLIRVGLLALFLAALTGLGWYVRQVIPAGVAARQPAEDTVASPTPAVRLPRFQATSLTAGIPRRAELYTIIPNRPSLKIRKYTVKPGDTAWSIAQKFNLQPESILWGNEWLSTNAGNLSVGAELNILPEDGVLHTVKEGDTVESIAAAYGVTVQSIVEFISNRFDPLPPYEINPGQQLVVPGGSKPLVWQEPGPPVIPGLGRRSPGLYSGPLVNLGTGYYIWPTAPPIVLTQEFWGGHPAIDIDTYFRQPVFVADSGTVIFSGWSESGYGNLVIVDHANGYWTYYAHNEANLVSVGQGVVQGQQIAESGTTGNSTGYHLDFRVRVDGGSFLNPLDFLP